jgi:hypothetical protein
MNKKKAISLFLRLLAILAPVALTGCYVDDHDHDHPGWHDDHHDHDLHDDHDYDHH